MDRESLKAMVREILIELLSPVATAEANPDQWLDLPKAWQILGYPSYQALHKDVERGLFRPGEELRDRRKPGAKIARWQINIAAANKRLQQDPLKRRSV